MDTTNGTMRHRGPSLLAVETVFPGRFVANLVLVTVLAGGQHSPSPFAPDAADWFSRHRTAVRIGAFLQFGASIPLGIYTATIVSRMQFFGLRAAGPHIALFGGLSASFFLAVSALIQWVLAQDGIAVSGATARTLHYLAFATGGFGHVVPLGLLLAGISLTAGPPPPPSCPPSGWYFQPRWSFCRWPASPRWSGSSAPARSFRTRSSEVRDDCQRRVAGKDLSGPGCEQGDRRRNGAGIRPGGRNGRPRISRRTGPEQGGRRDPGCGSARSRRSHRYGRRGRGRDPHHQDPGDVRPTRRRVQQRRLGPSSSAARGPRDIRLRRGDPRQLARNADRHEVPDPADAQAGGWRHRQHVVDRRPAGSARNGRV